MDDWLVDDPVSATLNHTHACVRVEVWRGLGQRTHSDARVEKEPLRVIIVSTYALRDFQGVSVNE